MSKVPSHYFVAPKARLRSSAKTFRSPKESDTDPPVPAREKTTPARNLAWVPKKDTQIF